MRSAPPSPPLASPDHPCCSQLSPVLSGTPEFQEKVIKLKGPDFDFRTYMDGAMPYFLNQLVGTCAAYLYIITHTPYTLICNTTLHGITGTGRRTQVRPRARVDP